MNATPCKPLSRDDVLLGWVSFFNDVSSEMIYPLLPLFIVDGFAHELMDAVLVRFDGAAVSLAMELV